MTPGKDQAQLIIKDSRLEDRGGGRKSETTDTFRLVQQKLQVKEVLQKALCRETDFQHQQ